MLYAICCLLYACVLLYVCCLLYAVYYMLYTISCMLYVICYMPYAICCMPYAICCMLYVILHIIILYAVCRIAINQLTDEELTEKCEIILTQRIKNGDKQAIFQLGQLHFEWVSQPIYTNILLRKVMNLTILLYDIAFSHSLRAQTLLH